MAKKRETTPQIHIDDLHPKHDGRVQMFKATWQEAGVIVTLWLDEVDRYNWRPGHYVRNAYELTSHIGTVSGRPLGPIQEETGFVIVRKLRARMLAAMTDAGWQQVDSTKEGCPIYQYRPSPRLTRESAAPEEKIESGLRELAPAGAGAGDEQHPAELERSDAPVITIDDLSEPPMSIARKLQNLEPLTYHAKAEQGDVKALITIRHYQAYRFPGGYILDEHTARVSEFATGRMSRQQEARARALLDQLRKQVEAALQAAGWEKRWTTTYGKGIWVYADATVISAAGPAAVDQVTGGPQALARSNDQVELRETGRDNPPDLVQRRSHIVEVVGSDEAKKRGQQPAYSREVFTREVTFTCVVCKNTVTQQRYPGHTPLYCSEGCREERRRERTRERVARHREKKKAEVGNKTSQEIVTL
jgi:hypothetical protein